MSPSKRLGGVVDPSAEHPAPAAKRGESAPSAERSNGNGHSAPAGEPGPQGGDKAGRHQRTTVDASTGLRAPAPVRGTSSARGASSSTITRRSDDAAPAPPFGAPLPPIVESRADKLARWRKADSPPPSLRERVDKLAKRRRRDQHPHPPAPASASTAVDLVPPSVVPLAMPPSQPDVRTADRLDVPLGPPPPLIGPSIAHEPPPTQASFTSHDIAPVARVLGRRPRVRKVTRVVRHVDPWSVFKIAAIFNLVLYGVALTAGVLLWNVAYATGTIDNLERFFESFGWDTFEFKGGEIYHSLWVAGLFGVIGLTGAAVLAATLFNLITDLVGGIRFTVLEEEVVERTAAPMRRFVVRRQSADGDPSGPLTGPPTNLPTRQHWPPTG